MKSQLTNDLVRRTLSKYQFSASDDQCEAIRVYIQLLLRWNQKVSLTTVVDPIEILRFHFGESLFAVSSVPIRNGRLADVGSGAGFPGIPLRLAVPDLYTVLIESNAKKAAFLSEVVRELRLSSVRVLRQRMEDVPEDVQQLDFVTARALGIVKTLQSWARARLRIGGKLILWLGQSNSLTLSADKTWSWGEPVHIPGSERRFILSGARPD
ncbi:MAG: 16S rRNA (guanine(527)-N(7))-methyltransferase RsmG [Candidatus Acidiferrales bacterium]